jgi:hypothetical protein
MVWGVNSSDDAMSWRRNSWWEGSNPLPHYDAATVAPHSRFANKADGRKALHVGIDCIRSVWALSQGLLCSDFRHEDSYNSIGFR